MENGALGDITNCPICGKHCPIESPSCPRGQSLVQKLKNGEEVDIKSFLDGSSRGHHGHRRHR